MRIPAKTLTLQRALVFAGVLAGTAAGAPARSGRGLEAPYTDKIGREYETIVPLDLFESVAEPHFFYLRVAGSHGPGILRDVIPAGARLRIRGETHDVSRPSGAQIGFLCELHYGSQELKIVNAEFIQTPARLADGRANPDIDPHLGRRLAR